MVTYVMSGIENASYNVLMSCNFSIPIQSWRLRFQEYARQLPTFDQYTLPHLFPL